MTAGARAFLILFVIALIGAAWLLRIDVKPGGEGGRACHRNRSLDRPSLSLLAYVDRAALPRALP